MKSREVAARLSQLLHQILTGKADRASVIRRLRRILGELEEAEAPSSAKPSPRKGTLEQLHQVWSHWCQTFGRSGASKFTADRQSKIRARMLEGYSVAQLCRAIDGCAASPFHRGDNPRGEEYVELSLILRNAEKVEHFVELAGQPTFDNPERGDRFAELERASRHALQEGNTDAYAEAQRKLRALRAATGGEPGRK